MSRILVVDDDPIARRIVAKTVEQLGHTPIQASTGERAWAVLEDNPQIALVCTDYQMPELDGRELTRRMRATSAAAKIPVIMISGVVLPHELSTILAEGVDRFLPKPLDRRQLTAYLEGFLPPLARSRSSHAA